MQGQRKQRYKLDIDDLLDPAFLTPVNSNKILYGLNQFGNVPLSPTIGGLGNTGSAFTDGQLVAWNAAAARFIPASLAGGIITYLPAPILIASGSNARGMTITVTGGGGSGAVLLPCLVDDGLNSVFIVNGGTGYGTTPTLTVSAPLGGGTLATCTATVTAGVITSVAVGTVGTNYYSLLQTSDTGYTWQTFSLSNISSLISTAGATGVLLYAEGDGLVGSGGAKFRIQARASATDGPRNLVYFNGAGGGVAVAYSDSASGIFPILKTGGGSFQHQGISITAPTSTFSASLFLVGLVFG